MYLRDLYFYAALYARVCLFLAGHYTLYPFVYFYSVMMVDTAFAVDYNLRVYAAAKRFAVELDALDG